MKFFKGQENARVYCKEVNTSNKTTVIVASEVLERKKQTKLTHKELNIIHRIAGYEYEKIRNDFQKLFEKSPEEQVGHCAQLLSYIFLSEAQKVMDRKGWTRKQLADEIGTSASYLTQLFRGDRLLNFKMVAKIEGALDICFEINVAESTESSINYPEKQDLEWEQTQVNEP